MSNLPSSDDLAKLAGAASLGPLGSLLEVVQFANKMIGLVELIQTKVDKQALADFENKLNETISKAKGATTNEAKLDSAGDLVDILKRLG